MAAAGDLPEPANAPTNSRVAWEGCSVLLDINDGDRLVFARLSPAATLKIGNKNCSLTPLVGCPFGTLFRVETGPKGPYLTRYSPSSSSATDVNSMQDRDDCRVKDESKDNRALVDNNTAQSLSSEDIDIMRREGATGDEIIEALIANSSTFGNKTVFSQEKYKLKKQKKYAPKVLLRRPFSRSICEAYFKKYPTRIGMLRVDTLSLLLSMANVTAYSDVLVVDMVGGMLTGAVAERLGDLNFPHLLWRNANDLLFNSTIGFLHRSWSLGVTTQCRIVQAPFSDLCSTQSNNNDGSESREDTQPFEIQSNIADDSLLTDCAPSSSSGVLEDGFHEDIHSCKDSVNSRETSISAAGVPGPMYTPACFSSINESSASSVHKSVSPGRQASPEAIKSWKEKGFTSLIVAAPEMEVGSIVEQLLPLLSYSAPFAIYHQYLQPLATCMHKLQASKLAIGLQISEPWLREYQVLPSRTHPHMQMSSSGGYILSGIRICNGIEACNGNK